MSTIDTTANVFYLLGCDGESWHLQAFVADGTTGEPVRIGRLDGDDPAALVADAQARFGDWVLDLLRHGDRAGVA